MPRNSQAASAKRRVERIHSASTRRRMSAPTANANGIANSVYPEYSIGGWIIMLGWRSSGFSPVPSGGATGERLRTATREDEQRRRRRRRSRAARRSPTARLAQAPAREEEHEARPQRQQQHPQQQRALLRGPRPRPSGRRAASSSTSASRRPRSEKSERRNAISRTTKRRGGQPGERVDGAAARVDPVLTARCARAVERRARCRRGDGEREDQAGACRRSPSRWPQLCVSDS